jgi:brefeldin A-inhibited guanine nucleotide-exchange protein
MPPSLSTTALTPHGAAAAQIPADIQLNRQGLECLVSVLRSLVTWGIGNDKLSAEGGVLNQLPKSATREESRHDSVNGTVGDGTTIAGVNESGRLSTPDLADDPGKFETAKHRKTMLLEGIKKFNFKQKKVRELIFELGVLLILCAGDSIPVRDRVHRFSNSP